MSTETEVTVATLENMKPEIVGVLEELASNHPAFFYIESDKVMKIIDVIWGTSEPGISKVSPEFLRSIIKEELIVFAKRNCEIITHKECFQVITRALGLWNDGASLNVNISNTKTIPVLRTY